MAGALTAGAHAIVITESDFIASGGDASDVRGSLDAGYAQARARSFAPPFRTVGHIGGCTATWLGDSPDGRWSYFLTAAHCHAYEQTRNDAERSFTDYAGRVTASGVGTFHVPEVRIQRPEGFGGASTDIGVLVLPRVASILDPQGQPVPPAVVYAEGEERGRVVPVVGYGSWGVGSIGSDGGLQPEQGPRRAAATNRIDHVFEQDHGLGTDFDDPNAPDSDATEFEGAVASGDSGSAWWQQHDGAWVVVATSNGGSGTTYGCSSTAARASRYTDWLESVYPQVTLHPAPQD